MVWKALAESLHFVVEAAVDVVSAVVELASLIRQSAGR